jgi:LuxR family maltose regulon positive regulatory protein
MPDQNPTILKTKLHRPPLPHTLVERTRLIEWLNQGIQHPLTLVAAPAGYGKSTLIGSWLDGMAVDQNAKTPSLPSAWLSLDEKDSELNIFLQYFISALRTIFTGACAETLDLLRAVRQPPDAVLRTTLCNELAELPRALDDYQFIHGEAVHNLLSELTEHWPTPLHLVIMSRIDPAIPLSRLRAKGMIHEIRTRDLRFTLQEARTYLGSMQFFQLSDSAVHLLEERFEGWPAGLHLAALSLRSAGDQESILSALSARNANVTGYLVDEVLSGQYPAIHSFLLKTSILDRFCAPLCEAVIGEDDASKNVRACLDWIESSELFIVPLDDRQVWYRYHHLFQELLEQRLAAGVTPDELANLHRRASDWYEKQGLLDEALQHAIAAGDLDMAARQMIAGLRDAINREDRQTLERWLGLMPDELIQRNPGLLMIKAWALQFGWRLDYQMQVIHQVEELLDSEASKSLPAEELQLLRGQTLLPRAQQAYFSNQTAQAIDLCRQILAIFPRSWTFVRGGGMIYIGLSMRANGQAVEAERLLKDEYEAYSDKGDTFGLFVLETLGFNYLNTGQLEQARQIGQMLRQNSIRSNMPLMQHWAEWILGLVCYLRNELEDAAEYFSQIFEARYNAQISPFRDAVAGLALIHQIKGERAEAWRMLEAISQFDMEQSGSEDNRTRSLRARLMLMQGDLEGARQWAGSFTGPPPDQAFMWLEEPQVTRARILVAEDARTHLQAPRVLDVLEEITQRTFNTRFKVEILALHALSLNTQGETGEASAVLKRALDLARAGRMIRVFIDLGQPMQDLLHGLANQGHYADMANRIRAASEGEYQDQNSQDSATQPRNSAAQANSALAEPLTPRELDVLRLLQGPASNKEITQELCISYATVKSHTISIYGKLSVNNRKDAVARAKELKLLPSD